MVQLGGSSANCGEKDGKEPQSVGGRGLEGTESAAPLDIPPSILHPEDGTTKKRKKRRAKKKGTRIGGGESTRTSEQTSKSPVLCISRNKHWRYISSYHVCFLPPP
jgi:hypothetical protein